MDVTLLKEKYAPWLVAIYHTGSSVCPWIENPHDTDYLIFVTDLTDKRIEELYTYKPKGESWIVTCVGKKQNPRIFSYERYFEELVYGDMIEDELYFIFDHEIEYKKCLIDFALGRPFKTYLKFWYHILTAIYLFDNDDYYINDEQKELIELCHSKEMTQDLYDYIQYRLQQWADELK